MCTRSFSRARHQARRSGLAALLAAACLALVPATAMAQGEPTDAQYGSTLDQISQGGAGNVPGGGGGGGDGGPSEPSSGGSAEASDRIAGGLPFTGFDVGVLALVAVVFGAAGVLLYRRNGRLSEDGASR